MSDEQEDLHLIRSDPAGLLEKYQEVIAIIAGRYAASGYYPFSECDEVVQHVNERLLNRINRIQENYNGSTRVTTYLSVIIRNIVTEHLRGMQRLVVEEHKPSMECIGEQPTTGIENLAVEEEIKRFGIVLSLFGNQKRKLELCIKLYYRLPVSKDDFFSYAKRSKKMIDELFLNFLNSPEPYPDKNLFAHITPWFNAVEGKRNLPDALRKWVTARLNELINLMNGNPPFSAHTEETIGILAEKYFCQLEDKKQSS